jgi:hypothetical protein
MDGEDRPVAYFAKHMSKTERNYSTSEKELLAIVKSIEFFKQYLYGKEFVLVTDTCCGEVVRICMEGQYINMWCQKKSVEE